ncbi:MAG: hypothetical protein PHX72_00205 [Candidatus Shapirobacteria bacterium]|nr:hypothetical protein [Candidatus Shapirobacteria bacterium]
MKIKITPFNNKDEQLRGEFKVGNNFYYGKFHSSGVVTEIRAKDDWLDQEMAWLSRSEIPFITALRHTRVKMYSAGTYLVSGGTPFIRKFGPFYKTLEVEKFPSKDECRDLIREYCRLATDESYHFTNKGVAVGSVLKLFRLFDYNNDFFIRAGSCLYKAYILLNTSSTFAEEIYTNTFIALEAIIEYIKQRDGVKDRKKIVEKISSLKSVNNFEDYEEEMRDGIRNDIIHPFRDKYGEAIAQPFMMADFVYEDLAFVDWLFKQVLVGKL